MITILLYLASEYFRNSFFFLYKSAVPALYPFWEKKGMAFPYYHIQMYMTFAALYVSGLGEYKRVHQ